MSLDALGTIALDVLQRMVREVLARRPGGHLVEASLDRLDLRLPLPLKGPAADPDAFARELAAHLERLVDDAIQHAAAFRPGHAFCHRDGLAGCEHSAPPSSRHVFTGYGPTGLPRWEDFAQHALDLGHPEVDRLFADPPVLVTLQRTGQELNGALLGAFDAGSYELLGQVAAGFFPVRPEPGEGRTVVAITFQVAASRGRAGGARKLGLNLLGRAPGGGDLALLWERQPDLPWRSAVRWAQAALSSIRGRPSPDRIEGILSGLARRLSRDRRARDRRTAHAEVRHASGERPTRKAVEDTREARREEILFDERRGTLVVLGERGRTHFYSAEGRLVSSVRYSRDAVERKRKLGLWRAASEEEARVLREM